MWPNIKAKQMNPRVAHFYLNHQLQYRNYTFRFWLHCELLLFKNQGNKIPKYICMHLQKEMHQNINSGYLWLISYFF